MWESEVCGGHGCVRAGIRTVSPRLSKKGRRACFCLQRSFVFPVSGHVKQFRLYKEHFVCQAEGATVKDALPHRMARHFQELSWTEKSTEPDTAASMLLCIVAQKNIGFSC